MMSREEHAEKQITDVMEFVAKLDALTMEALARADGSRAEVLRIMESAIAVSPLNEKTQPKFIAVLLLDRVLARLGR